jgi:hypothetical protein
VLLDDLLEATNSLVQIRQMLLYTGHGAVSLDIVIGDEELSGGRHASRLTRGLGSTDV